MNPVKNHPESLKGTKESRRCPAVRCFVTTLFQKTGVFLIAAALCLSAACPAFAVTAVTFSEDGTCVSGVSEGILKTPSGCVILIVDGLGAAYVYPETDGSMLDGSPAGTARLPRFAALWEDGFRAANVSVLNPVTDRGHSAIVTGNEKAEKEMVGYAGSTVQDILRDNGFLCFGVMNKGDFSEMRREFDVIVYDPSNSIDSAQMAVDVNGYAAEGSRKETIVGDVSGILKSRAEIAPSCVTSKDTADRYAGYNTWGLETAGAVVSYMASSCPDQKYLLIVNIGAVDSTGHYRGYYAYLDAVERLDGGLADLAVQCRENNVAFVLTADHGMTFAGADKKGGHSSSKYAKCRTSLEIPLLIFSPNAAPAFFNEPAGQQDIAPTVLSLFEISDRPRHASGTALPVKEKATLTIVCGPEKSFTLSGYDENGNERRIYTPANTDDAFRLHGLPKGAYTVSYDEKDLFGTKADRSVVLDADMTIDLTAKNESGSDAPAGPDALRPPSAGRKEPFSGTGITLPFLGHVSVKTAACLILLLVVNGAGLRLIRNIVRKK